MKDERRLHHLGDIMNGKTTILLSGLVAVLMVTCAIPFMASEDSDALTGNSNLSLDKSSAIIFVSGTAAEKKCTFTVDLTNAPAGTTASDVNWKLSAIGDGSTLVSFTQYGSSYTKNGSISATVYSRSTGSIEVVAYINGTTDYYASAVVVVKQGASATADEFHFYVKIDGAAYNYVHNNCLNLNGTQPTVDLPTGYYLSDFTTGFWIDVSQSDTGLTDADFNAQSALEWYLNDSANAWANDFGSYGWINSLLGLESYQGAACYDNDNNYVGDYWYYWAQYTLTNSGWTFNNTTLDFITEEGSSYIGLIFWRSPPTMDVPTPAPDFPA